LRSYRSCNFKVIQHNIHKRNRSTSLDAVLLGTLRGTLRLAKQCVSQACSLLYIVCLHGAFGSWKEYGTPKKSFLPFMVLDSILFFSVDLLWLEKYICQLKPRRCHEEPRWAGAVSKSSANLEEICPAKMIHHLTFFVLSSHIRCQKGLSLVWRHPFF
jgi:hypothetical protein